MGIFGLLTTGRGAAKKQPLRITAIEAIALVAPLSAPAEDFGRIYVCAQRQTAARSWLPISCGSAVVAELRRGAFFAINVAPGRHTLGSEKGIPVFVDIRSGEESFVRLDWNHKIGRPAIPVLSKVRPTEARREMMYLS